MKYRKKNGSDTYHWCTNCSNWPTSDYKEYDGQPNGDQCNECRGKRDNGNCQSKS